LGIELFSVKTHGAGTPEKYQELGSFHGIYGSFAGLLGSFDRILV